MIVSYFHQPGIQDWWRLRRAAYSRPFREFLESSSRPEAMISTTEQLSRADCYPADDDRE